MSNSNDYAEELPRDGESIEAYVERHVLESRKGDGSYILVDQPNARATDRKAASTWRTKTRKGHALALGAEKRTQVNVEGGFHAAIDAVRARARLMYRLYWQQQCAAAHACCVVLCDDLVRVCRTVARLRERREM